MNIVIIGEKMRKIVEFNDIPVALKITSGGRTTYYHLHGRKLSKAFGRKQKRLIEVLVRRDSEDVKKQF